MEEHGDPAPICNVCLRTVDHESGIIARERDVSKSGYCSDLANFDKLLRLSHGLLLSFGRMVASGLFIY